MDGSEPGPHVEQGSCFRHLLQLSFLLQESILGDDGNGLKEWKIFTGPQLRLQSSAGASGTASVYPEPVELQRFGDVDQLLHLPHLPHLGVALVNDL